MKIVFTGYVNVEGFDDPYNWLRRIKGYTGIPEALSKYHTVISIEQINYSGKLIQNGVEYHFLNFKKKRDHFPLKLHRYIKKMDPDIVIVHSFHFPLQVALLKSYLKKHTKIIVHNHAEKPFAGTKKYAQQIADRCIDAYIFTSAEMGEEWVK
ncbi:MAG: glycosyltransferase, partial [Panacibacter sp.]